jgi:hypothetical protein
MRRFKLLDVMTNWRWWGLGVSLKLSDDVTEDTFFEFELGPWSFAVGWFLDEDGE